MLTLLLHPIPIAHSSASGILAEQLVFCLPLHLLRVQVATSRGGVGCQALHRCSGRGAAGRHGTMAAPDRGGGWAEPGGVWWRGGAAAWLPLRVDERPPLGLRQVSPGLAQAGPTGRAGPGRRATQGVATAGGKEGCDAARPGPPGGSWPGRGSTAGHCRLPVVRGWFGLATAPALGR